MNPVSMWVSNEDGTVIRINQSLCQTFGVSDDGIVGKYNVFNDRNFENAGVMPLIRAVYEKHEAAGFSLFWNPGFVDTVDFKEGRAMYIDVSMFPVLSSQGKLRCVVCQWSDVSDLKRSNALLEDALFKLDEVIKAGNVGLWDWDLKTDKVHYSKEWKRQIGYEADEISDEFEEWRSRVHPDDLEQTLETVQQNLTQTRDKHEVEFRFRHRDGSYRWILSHAAVIKDGTGHPLRMIGSHIDMTDRKRMEQKLRQSQSLLQRVFDILPVGLWFADHNGKLIKGNPAGIRIWGAEPHVGPDEYGVFKARRLPSMEELAPDDWALARTIRDGVTIKDEVLEIDAFDGTKKTILNYTSPVLDNDGNVEAAVIINVDISDRVRAEKDKRKLESKLHQARKMESIGNLAGGIAHDFNNILSSVIGFTELSFEEAEKGSVLEDNLQEIYSAGKRAKNIVRQILAFARQSQEEVKPIQPSVVAKEFLSFIRSSIPSTIKIKHAIDSDSFIMGNQTQIYQVLMNLFINAADAMEDSSGLIELSIKDIAIDPGTCGDQIRLPEGDYIQIKVYDTGKGISPDIVHSIFEPYFTTKAFGKGTGMGLSVVYGIVESYSGSITVDSELSKGTTFTICFPVTEQPLETGYIAPEKLPGGNETILFVDDEPAIAAMGQRVLQSLGYSVKTRTSSVEAFKLFKSKPDAFDLVISDLTMPDLTGDILAAELMRIRPDIPVILCSGYSKKISDETASGIGIKAFAYKPIVKVDLAKMVRKVLDGANR